MIIIVAAIAGITRLALQQRRQQKMHLLDDFRSSLERLSNQPLPAHGRASVGAGRKTIPGRLPFNHKKRAASPRGEWDRVAHPEPMFAAGSSLAEEGADDFFGHSGRWEDATPPPLQPARDEFLDDEPARSRRKREPLLAGRLWAKPRDPWLWTYDKKPRRSAAKTRSRADVEYVDFAENDVVYAAEGNLAHSGYGTRSPQSSPNFAGPRGSASRGGLDPAQREAAKRRLEVRRRTGSRLS